MDEGLVLKLLYIILLKHLLFISKNEEKKIPHPPGQSLGTTTDSS